MDWYSYVSIHKPASRAMLYKCLMILDHLVEMLNNEHLKPYFKKGLTAISKLQMQFSILKVFKIIEEKKNFMALFYGWGSTASRLEPLRRGSLLFTTKFPEIPGNHFINLEI